MKRPSQDPKIQSPPHNCMWFMKGRNCLGWDFAVVQLLTGHPCTCKELQQTYLPELDLPLPWVCQFLPCLKQMFLPLQHHKTSVRHVVSSFTDKAFFVLPKCSSRPMFLGRIYQYYSPLQEDESRICAGRYCTQGRYMSSLEPEPESGLGSRLYRAGRSQERSHQAEMCYRPVVIT